MFKFTIRPQWVLETLGQRQTPLPSLLELCNAIHDRGNLVEACRVVDLSYRHAWGLLREAGRIFGTPLVEMTRGRGAKLTAFGEKLLWADKRIAARLSPILDSLASELQSELERMQPRSSQGLRMHASHGFAVAELHAALNERGTSVELNYTASQSALASLTKDGCELAGFHVPLGDLQSRALALYAPWLEDKNLRLIHLATRRQGLMVMPGNAKNIVTLRDLRRADIRFVNRQPGSGTRILLDLMLEAEHIPSASIHGYENGEFTHAAVAAYIASGMADVGMGVETAARRFNLDFVPLATERYFLACRIASLQAETMQPILKLLASRAFKTRVNQLPGYNAKHMGQILTVAEAFS